MPANRHVRRVDRTLPFQELCGDTGGLDNERTISDADGGRTSDERPFGPQSLPGFERQPASWPLPLRRARRVIPAHIDGGRFAPLVDRSSSDA